MEGKLEQSFDVEGPIALDVRIAAGALTIAAEDAATAAVEVEPLDEEARRSLRDVRIVMRGGTLHVAVPERHVFLGDTPEFAVLVRCPAGSDARVRSAVAPVVVTGALDSLSCTTASANVEVERVSDVRIRTASGAVELGAVLAAGNLTTASGAISVRDVDGELKAQTASGAVRLDSVSASASVRTVSGDIEIAVERGLDLWLDLRSVSGDTTSELDSGNGGERDAPIAIRARSVSGDVRVTRSVRAEPAVNA